MAERIQNILAVNMRQAREARDIKGLKTLKKLSKQVYLAEQEGLLRHDLPNVSDTVQPAALVSERSPSHEQLYEELRAHGQEVALPEPPEGFLEIQTILTGEGFDVAPIVYVDRKRREATYALLDKSRRPHWDQKDYPADAYSPIVQKGRREKSIEVPSWITHVPETSRFGISWDEVYTFIAPAVVNLSPDSQEQFEKSGALLRLPTKDEFQTAGRLRYDHLGKSRSWEWLHDDVGHGRRLLGGRSGVGGLEAVDGDPSDGRDDGIWFRLQAVFPPQKLA